MFLAVRLAPYAVGGRPPHSGDYPSVTSSYCWPPKNGGCRVQCALVTRDSWFSSIWIKVAYMDRNGRLATFILLSTILL